MAIGDKIKSIRTLRGMTQKELGLSIGLPAKSADVRIAQYEIGARVPKENLVKKIAKVLCIKPEYLLASGSINKEDIMRWLFYIDEYGMLDITSAKDSDSDSDLDKIVQITFPFLDEHLEEWYDKKQQFENGEITEDEYLEWKMNWPDDIDIIRHIGPILK